MRGTDVGAIKSVRAATSLPFTAAGGISGWDEVRALEAEGIDAVVGMAIYTGRMNPAAARPV
jgi:phosphoribosylformimino-5-aminoimidazole carboxamide ribotide isomerase